MVPALAIELALDHKPSHREMTSRLISVLYLKVLIIFARDEQIDIKRYRFMSFDVRWSRNLLLPVLESCILVFR